MPRCTTPVMVAEVLEHLAPERGGVFVDCTVGLGGHARALLEAGASRVIGLDRDPSALERSRDALAAFGDRMSSWFTATTGTCSTCSTRAASAGWTGCWRIWACRRCSSTRRTGGSASGATSRSTCAWIHPAATTAAEMLAAADEQTLADVIYEFGEERHARRVARAIVAGAVAGADHRRPGGSPTSFAGRFRARGTRGSIRRRARSRRSASG